MCKYLSWDVLTTVLDIVEFYSHTVPGFNHCENVHDIIYLPFLFHWCFLVIILAVCVCVTCYTECFIFGFTFLPIPVYLAISHYLLRLDWFHIIAVISVWYIHYEILTQTPRCEIFLGSLFPYEEIFFSGIWCTKAYFYLPPFTVSIRIYKFVLSGFCFSVTIGVLFFQMYLQPN